MSDKIDAERLRDQCYQLEKKLKDKDSVMRYNDLVFVVWGIMDFIVLFSILFVAWTHVTLTDDITALEKKLDTSIELLSTTNDKVEQIRLQVQQ